MYYSVFIAKKFEKLVGLYLDDPIPLEVLNDKKPAIQSEKATLEVKLDKQAEIKKELSIQEASAILAKTPADVRQLSYEDQKILVRQLISKVVLKADTVQVHWRFT